MSIARITHTPTGVKITNSQPTRNVLVITLYGKGGKKELRAELESMDSLDVPIYTEDFAKDGETITIELKERWRIFLGC